DQGTILVAAAGNYGDPAKQRAPAAYPEVITVSAMADFDGRPGGKGRQSQACLAGSATERDDAFTTFSSYGSAVDLIAPGKCIWVAAKGGAYARVAGTSFSTPIVLAVALRYRQRYPSARPNQVRMALIRAGRTDWRVGTDPDDRHEPRVDMRHFRKPPTFRYDRVDRRTVRRAGGTVTIRLHRDRLHGHTADIRVRVAKAPTGVRVSIDGSRLRVKATSSARTGRQQVLIRATDGEVTTTVKVPLRVRRG
ncbi:MAG: S8 family serine peptidase, partial [Chloroflexota bacterium]